MTTRHAARAALIGIGGIMMTAGHAGACGVPVELLADRAISTDTAEADQAIATLRSLGRQGLDALVERHAESIEACERHLLEPEGPSDPTWSRISRALDAVGRHYDNFSARLYWHTDLASARQAALSSGRPILSLRLLGRLDEDLSCANSRFFRTALYANEAVSSRLRDGFVLHWESVRPVPRITIEFGDGRSLVRTITGNSVHYVLDHEGRPLDALPGLCDPVAFQRWLDEAGALHRGLAGADETQRGETLRRYHAQRLDAVLTAWGGDLERIGRSDGADRPAVNVRRADGRRPDALAVMPIAVTKSAVERPVLEAIAVMSIADALEEATSDEAWQAIAALHRRDARLDGGSRLLMAKKHGREDLEATIERFEQSIALDTVRNRYLYHRPIHEWFVNGQVGSAEQLTRRIYDELFLTPGDDPWLGLRPEATYAGLDGGGVR